MSPADEDPWEQPDAQSTSDTENAPSTAQEGDWVPARIATAREGSAIVSDSIANRLSELLHDPFANHALAKSELAEIAKELLIAAASPGSTEAGSQ